MAILSLESKGLIRITLRIIIYAPQMANSHNLLIEYHTGLS